MSRDGHTMIIVSFQDVKRCLEAAWLEYCEIANPAAATPELGHLVGSEHEVPPQLVPAYMMGDIGRGGRKEKKDGDEGKRKRQLYMGLCFTSSVRVQGIRAGQPA
ncbi:hypothetical protein Naga_100187g1 [Nannochloropsis gaditana]|uniref:Uncharacterized protein n=1 Tax=Nannochloropsis gaditana TaxID=72520 RepID=W7U4U8_9STRA|nr:hypothetical protein Naga_100187g1 [Nannochloropsis gaditana]